MKGLFPTAQFGAQQINASRSSNRNAQRHTYNYHNREELPILCSRCAEPIDAAQISLRSALAAAFSIGCMMAMFTATLFVQAMQNIYPYRLGGEWTPATVILISIAVFIACVISHITVAHRVFDMSISRMFLWSTNLGCFGAGLAMALSTWAPQLRENRWITAMNWGMWGWLGALFGVYVVEAIRLSGSPNRADCTEARNEKAAL